MQTMLFIGGEWRPASDGGTFPVLDPATEKSITEVSNATAEDVTSAVHVAYTAGKDWAKKLPRERAEVLRNAFNLLTECKQEIAELMTLENGKALEDSLSEADYACLLYTSPSQRDKMQYLIPSYA